MRHAPAIVLAAAALLAGCGQPALSARIDVPSLRIAEPSQVFPGVALAAFDPSTWCSTFLSSPPPECVSQAIDYDIGGEIPMLKEKGVNVDLRLTDVSLTLSAGAANLGGISSAELDLRNPTSGTFIRLGSYVRPAPTSTPTSITMSGSSNVNLADYLSDGKLDARVAVEMDPGDPVFLSGFTATVEAGFSVVVTLDYSAYF